MNHHHVRDVSFQAAMLDEMQFELLFMDSPSTEINDGFGRKKKASQIEYTIM